MRQESKNARGVPDVTVLFVAATAMLTVGCGVSHAGRTVGRGVLQVEGGLGGPMVTNLGGAIPIPNIPLGVRYGLADRVDISGHINPLSLIMGGFLALDTSVTWAWVKHRGDRGFNLASSAGLALMTDFQSGARLSPLVDLAGGYTYRWFTTFMGAEVIVDPWGGNVAVNPYGGFEFDIRRLTLSTAFVWYHVGHDVTNSAIRYVTGSSSHGSAGVMIGIKCHWDLSHRRGSREES